MKPLECIERENVGRVSVIRFKDKRVMNPDRIEQLGRELMVLVGDDEPDQVLLNFDNVSFLSSAALNKLIVFEKRIRAAGGQVRLSNLRSEVRDLFNYTKLDTIFKIDDEQSDSLMQFENHNPNA